MVMASGSDKIHNFATQGFGLTTSLMVTVFLEAKTVTFMKESFNVERNMGLDKRILKMALNILATSKMGFMMELANFRSQMEKVTLVNLAKERCMARVIG